MTAQSKLAVALAMLFGAALIFFTAAEGADDKALHAGFSTIIGVGAGVATMNIEDTTVRRSSAIGLCMVPGFAKELTDEKIDPLDLVADLAGCGFGLLIFDGINVMAGDDKVIVSWRF